MFGTAWNTIIVQPVAKNVVADKQKDRETVAW